MVCTRRPSCPGLSWVNPANLIAVPDVALAANSELATVSASTVFGGSQITDFELTKPDQLIGNAKADHSAQTG